MNELDEILEKTSQSFLYNESEVDMLAKKLTEHMNNKLYFNTTPLGIYKENTISDNYATKNLRQSFFEECTFRDVNFCDAGLSGSSFSKTNFEESNFTNTNFQSCSFRECSFSNIKSGLNHTRFNKSVFIDTIFDKSDFYGVLFDDVIFINCTFTDCNWAPISLENAIFRDCHLNNVKFKSMNFEFVAFENIKLDNVKLPFPTIPYIYNGLNYLRHTNDNVRITSAKNKNGLTIEEYMLECDTLEKFYKSTQNYFPLANIFIMKNEYDKAISAVVKGIGASIELRRFRMLKNYCKLLKYIPDTSAHIRQIIYEHILNKICKTNLTPIERNILNSYLPEVREILLKDSDKEKVEILLTTNIMSTDDNRLAVMIDEFDKALKGNGCDYFIELSHNCPLEALITFFVSNSEMIKTTIELITATVCMINTGIKHKMKHDNKKNHNADVSTNINITINNTVIIANNTMQWIPIGNNTLE